MTTAPLRAGVALGDDDPYECRGPRISRADGVSWEHLAVATADIGPGQILIERAHTDL